MFSIAASTCRCFDCDGSWRAIRACRVSFRRSVESVTPLFCPSSRSDPEAVVCYSRNLISSEWHNLATAGRYTRATAQKFVRARVHSCVAQGNLRLSHSDGGAFPRVLGLEEGAKYPGIG